MENEITVKEEQALYRSYLPSAFIIASLPLRDIKNSYFQRKYNDITMSITGAPKVPYGNYGRLILSLLTTHAVLDEKDESGCVVINYEKEKDFLDELQAVKTRAEEYRNQLSYFSNSSFVFTAKIQKKVQRSLFDDLEGEGNVNVSLYNSGNIPFIKSLQYYKIEDENMNEDKKRRCFRIVLNQDFVKICVEHSVPINYTVYNKIKNATGKDLYAWFVYRNNFLKENENLFISREKLVEQFMPVAESSKNYKMQINTNYQILVDRIKEIKEYYPELNVRVLPEGFGIQLSKSDNQILPNDKRYMLITSQL